MQKGLSYWDDYRESKFMLIKNYVLILKQQKRLRVLNSFMLIHKTLHNGLLLLEQEKKRRRIALRSLFIAIRFHCNYKFKFKKPNGDDFGFRQRNLIRRNFSVFTVVFKEGAVETKAKRIIKSFLEHFYPSMIFQKKAEQFMRAAKYIYSALHRLSMARMYRKKYLTMVFDRELKFLNDFFVPKKTKQNK